MKIKRMERSLLFLLSLCLAAAAAPLASGAGLEPGAYTSRIGPAELLRDGARFELSVRTEEGLYRVEGTLEGGSVRCRLFAPDGNPLPCEASAGEGWLEVRTGGETYRFTRREAAPPRAPEAGPPAPPGGERAAPGEVGDPALGFRFAPPEGWLARRTESGFALGSRVRKGLILVLPSDVGSLEEARAEAQKGIADAAGTRLLLSGPLEPLGERGLAGEFRGTVEGAPARARVALTLSPFGGGVLVIVAVEEASYDGTYAALAEAIARSVKFSGPPADPEVQLWAQRLGGQKLTYIHSYSSGGPSFGGYSTYSGESTKRERYLCSDGRFFSRASRSFSLDAGGGFMGGGRQDAGAGTWRVRAVEGKPVLEFQYQGGNVERYVLHYRERGTIKQRGTYLNGRRWFVTPDNPACR